jgi:hypothetical protein
LYAAARRSRSLHGPRDFLEIDSIVIDIRDLGDQAPLVPRADNRPTFGNPHDQILLTDRQITPVLSPSPKNYHKEKVPPMFSLSSGSSTLLVVGDRSQDVVTYEKKPVILGGKRISPIRINKNLPIIIDQREIAFKKKLQLFYPADGFFRTGWTDKSSENDSGLDRSLVTKKSGASQAGIEQENLQSMEDSQEGSHTDSLLILREERKSRQKRDDDDEDSVQSCWKKMCCCFFPKKTPPKETKAKKESKDAFSQVSINDLNDGVSGEAVTTMHPFLVRLLYSHNKEPASYETPSRENRIPELTASSEEHLNNGLGHVDLWRDMARSVPNSGPKSYYGHADLSPDFPSRTPKAYEPFWDKKESRNSKKREDDALL